MPLGNEDIQALATALKSLQPESATVNATSVKIPAVWSGNPEVGFRQVESHFATRKITVQLTKLDYVIQALDNNTADRVQAIILSPPEEDLYDRLKEALIEVFGKSQAEKDQEILDFNGLGDKKPSKLLQHMNNLNADQKTLFKALSWHNFLRKCAEFWPCQEKQTSRIWQKRRTGSWKFPNSRGIHK